MNGKKTTKLRPRDHRCVHSQCQFLSLGHPRQCLHCSSKWSSSPTPVHHTSNQKHHDKFDFNFWKKHLRNAKMKTLHLQTITCSYIFNTIRIICTFLWSSYTWTPCQVTGFASHALHRFHGSPDVFRPKRRSWRKRCRRQRAKHPVTSSDS